MDLKEYLDTVKLNGAELARTLKIPKSSMYAYLSGTNPASVAFAMKVYEFTKGKVTLKDLHDYTIRVRKKLKTKSKSTC